MTTDDEAIYESVVFLDYFSDLPDPRQLIKVIYRNRCTDPTWTGSLVALLCYGSCERH